MRNIGLFLYQAIVRLHPPSFRREFGCEMEQDFQEAARCGIPARLYADAFLSVARQWLRAGSGSAPQRPRRAAASLLAGEYAVVPTEALTPLEWSRGVVAATMLLALSACLLGAGARIPPDSGIAYAAKQTVAAAQSTAPQSGVRTAHNSGTPSHAFTQFDVASVRENRTGTVYTSFPFSMGNGSDLPTHGYMHAIGIPLPGYIQFAYNMTPNQIVAITDQLPDWARSTRYDIEARVEGNPNKRDMRTMLRALLADRFKLHIRTETHIGKVYDLVIAKPGKVGRALHQHSAADAACAQKQADGEVQCGTIAHRPDPKNGLMRMMGNNVAFADYLLYASPKVDRPIIDKTGLTGKYDFSLQFAIERVGRGPDPNASDLPAGPTFAEALQEQMGLKLVPDKAPITTYIVDHIEKPTEN